ncbi:MAG TPA: hypothetical protein ENI33_08195 [Thermoplasmatales archaeon]|nr:hypothetical protein [Thermoplasmatales archaeon]
MKEYMIAVAGLFLIISTTVSAEFQGFEAYDEKGDCSSDGNKVDFPDGDLIYSSVIEKNGHTILTAEVLGKMRKSIYCEFNIYTPEKIVKVYYNGGHIFVYYDDEGGITENCTFRIEKNKIEINLPWLFKSIENVSVNIDLKEGSYWYFDKIPMENFHPLSEKKKTGGFDFVGIVVSIAILYLILKIHNKHF